MATKGLAKCMYAGKHLLLYPQRGNQPTTLRPPDTCGMGFIGNEGGTILTADMGNVGQWGHIAIHRVDGFYGYKELHLAMGMFGQQLLQVPHIVMTERILVAAYAQPDAIYNTGMAKLVVYKNNIAVAKGRKQAEIGIVTGIEQKSRLRLVEGGYYFFGLLCYGVIARYEPRPCRPHGHVCQ
jgi:hypothetical protein